MDATVVCPKPTTPRFPPKKTCYHRQPIDPYRVCFLGWRTTGVSFCHSVSFQDTAEVQSITLAARQAYALRCFQTGDLDKLSAIDNLEGPNNLCW